MNKKIYKSRTKKMVSGVCGGLEDYLGIDVTIIRLVWIIFALVSGFFPGLISYIIAAAIIPDEPVNNDNWTGNKDKWIGNNDNWTENKDNPWQTKNQTYESPYHSPYNDPTQTSGGNPASGNPNNGNTYAGNVSSDDTKTEK